MSVSEIMSPLGFDVRRQYGAGRFMDATRLSTMGLEEVADVLSFNFRPILLTADGEAGPYLYMIVRGVTCTPQVNLDGFALAEANSSLTRQSSAYATLRSLSARDLDGIEVYRDGETPPPSLAGWLQGCGIVAVWTRTARAKALARLDTVGMQVIRGVVVDFDTDAPVANMAVQLLDANDKRLGKPITTDAAGAFVIRTNQIGMLRLQSDARYQSNKTPPFRIGVGELVVVKLFVSKTKRVIAPLGIASRARAQPP
jgi:hypothetical protein